MWQQAAEMCETYRQSYFMILRISKPYKIFNKKIARRTRWGNKRNKSLIALTDLNVNNYLSNAKNRIIQRNSFLDFRDWYFEMLRIW